MALVLIRNELKLLYNIGVKMKKLLIIILMPFLICLFLRTIYADVPPIEHVIWDKAPINIILPVGKEKMVSFPGSVQFGYDTSLLSSNILRVQNNNGTLYLTAYKTFDPKRVVVKLIQDGSIILLNISAQKNADNTPMQVVLSEHPSSNQQSKLSQNHVNPITLLRFAENQLFAKKRFVMINPNIYVTPMHTSKTVPLVLDGRILATPLRSWRSGPYFITAVTLHNLSKDTVPLSQTRLCGEWKMAAFFPLMALSPEGGFRDTSTAFLVSTEPFSSAIGVCNGQEV